MKKDKNANYKKNTSSDIVVIRSNSIINNPRVKKISSSLNQLYTVVTFGWNRENVSKQLVDNYVVKLKLHNMKAPYAKRTLVFYMPLFWIWVFFKLIGYRPKIVHACDLDTVLPCYIYKILFRKILVFDVCDRYAMSRISPKSSFLYSSINRIEELFGRKADVLITVSEKLLDTFQKKPKKYNIIMNCPEKHSVEKIKRQNSLLQLVYTGNVVRSRGLERVAIAIKDLENVEFVFAGKVIHQDFLDELLRYPNLKYQGVLKLSEALSLEANSDVMIILYDLTVPINNYSMPNKLFEAMMYGLPIITNIAPEIIEQVKCGIKVDFNNLQQIRSAIIKLRDDKLLRKKLGDNGKKAFNEKYNWSIVEKKLFETYQNLLKNNL